MNGNMWIVTILVVVLGVAAVAIPAQLDESAETRQVTNEPHTLDVNGSVLGNAEEMVVFYDNETVTSPDGNTTYQRGDDYYINDTSIVGTSSTAGTDVVINYSYRAAGSTNQQFMSLFGIFSPVLPWLIILAVFGTLMAFLGWW